MKARVISYLNIRIGTPELLPHNNIDDKYFAPGDVIDIIEVVKGQEYKGNDAWYKLQDGAFVWSGGVEKGQQAGMSSVAYGDAELAKLAVDQNKQFLLTKFPNILSISDSVGIPDDENAHVIVIYLIDDDTQGLPDKLEVWMPDGMIRTIATEVVTNVGLGSIAISQEDQVTQNDARGSVCCIVDTHDGKKVVTAGHVYSKGKSINFHGELDEGQQTPAKINGSVIGRWFFQIINESTDVALAGIDDFAEDDICVSFKEHYLVKNVDVGRRTEVRVISNKTNPKVRTGFILDCNVKRPVSYKDEKVTKSNIIVIGNNRDRDKSVTLSQRGDSGGCVYEPVSNKLVGLILGGDNKFTWVLPLKEVFEDNNYNLC